MTKQSFSAHESSLPLPVRLQRAALIGNGKCGDVRSDVKAICAQPSGHEGPHGQTWGGE